MLSIPEMLRRKCPPSLSKISPLAVTVKKNVVEFIESLRTNAVEKSIESDIQVTVADFTENTAKFTHNKMRTEVKFV